MYIMYNPPDIGWDVLTYIFSQYYLGLYHVYWTELCEGDPYIIWTRILRRSKIWSQKSEISSVTAVMVLFAFLPHCGKIWPPPIRMRYISSEPEFWGDSRSEVRNLKFYLLHLYLANYCFNIYFNTVFSISWNLTIRITCQTYRWHISIYWSQIRWSPVKYFTTMFPQ